MMSKKPQTQRGFEQSEDWEEITEEPEESPWDPKLDESVSPDPLAAASGSILCTGGEKADSDSFRKSDRSRNRSD